MLNLSLNRVNIPDIFSIKRKKTEKETDIEKQKLLLKTLYEDNKESIVNLRDILLDLSSNFPEIRE